jgi:Lysyl oxidase
MKARVIMAALIIGGLVLTVGGSQALAGKPAQTALYPDLRTVVPQQLNLVNEQQNEFLRFSNGVANTGAGPWAIRPDPPPAEATTVTAAVQEIRDSNALYKCGEQPKQVTECYNVVDENVAGVYEYHPAHHHWHIGDIALYEVRKGSPTGQIVNENSIKTTFCLIDWYRLDGNSSTSERTFFDCFAIQGISSGWVDQYHQATVGQQVDLTDVPDGNDYYLVSTANYARTFVETNYTNNTAWVKFTLTSDSNGNRKVTVIGRSPCEAIPGMCGENAPNR